MSTEVQTQVRTEPPSHPEFLDVTGLPATVVAGLRTIVESLRACEGASVADVPPPAFVTPEERLRRFREFQGWVQTHGVHVGTVRDDRESIYEGRGE